MYKIIAALLLNLISLSVMPLAAAGDDAPTGKCKAICSLPVDLAGAD